LIGATNRPHEIDDAAQRRFRKKLYIPLPEAHGRERIIKNQLSKNQNSLTEEQVADVVEKTEGYSGSDVANLISEAAMGPLRDLSGKDMRLVKDDDVRPISHQDFLSALTQVRSSISKKDLEGFLEYDKAHGSLK
jgi:fidgetin-like protein 1